MAFWGEPVFGQAERDRSLVLSETGSAGVIAGRIWMDENRNGIREDAEYGVPNGLVKLTTPSSQVLSITLTDILGEYRFEGLPAGDYIIEFVPPLGYRLVSAYQVGASTHNSDASPQTGATTAIVLMADGLEADWDAGIYREGSTVSGRVWTDLNQDNAQNDSEFGYVDMRVTLYNAFGRAIQIVYTDRFGDYRFENVLSSEYSIAFDLPNGANNQSVSASGLRLDGAGRTQPFIVDQNASIQNLDLVLLPTPTSLDVMTEPGQTDDNSQPISRQKRLLPRSYMPVVVGFR